MKNFDWIAVVVSLILGLGVARLLISVVSIFQARRRVVLDWPPLIWAATIFLESVAFWWSLEESASRVTAWTLPFWTLWLVVLHAVSDARDAA